MTTPSTYKFNHTMLRVKDPKISIEFYSFIGLKVIKQLDFPDAKFCLYFLAYDSPQSLHHGESWTNREGILELTHNYGTENDDMYKVNNGNVEPYRGFGSIAVSVDNLQAACQRLEDNGHKFHKKLNDGEYKNIAFALDPDGYWVELIGQKPLDETERIKETNVETYRLATTMIRVRDPQASLAFYQDVMGMKLMTTYEVPAAGFNLYFLGYPGKLGLPPPEAATNVNLLLQREGVLELTWNYGTEKQEGFSYHDGNKEPQGFGHICVSVDDLDKACERFEDLKVNWKKRLTDGKMKNIAFLLDPDGYWIEIVQNEELKARVNWQ